MQSIEEWSKTVSSNPTIIKFKIASFLNLLTTQRFSGDSNIKSKQGLIQKAQQKFIDSSIFCYNNCSERGSCQPTGYFGFGQCRCNSGWSGVDCSNLVRAPMGLLASVYPGDVCSTNYTLGTYDLGLGCTSDPLDFFFFRRNPCPLKKRFPACSLTGGNMTVGSAGTFCGIIFSNLSILCDNSNPYSEPCPSGYSKYSWTTEGQSPTTLLTCQKNNTSLNDRSGTLCGLHSNADSGDQLTCNGYYPGRGKCPAGYTLRRGTFPNSVPLNAFQISVTLSTLSLCVKD